MDKLGEKLSVLILAGGPSRRMGQDKAWLDFGGVPLVEHIARRVLPLTDELIFSTNAADRFCPLQRRWPVPTRLVADESLGMGPLAGIASGLRIASYDLVLVLAVDMPCVQVPLLFHMASLAADYQAVIPLVPNSRSTEPAPEPLHALYRRSCLPAITKHLKAGHRRVISFLPDVRTRWVLPKEITRFDPDFTSFRNLNTPEDWEVIAGHSDCL